MDWKHLSFAHPFYFGLLLLIPFMIWWQRRTGRKADSPALRLTTLQGIQRIKPSFRVRFRPVLFVLRIIALVALIIALARPQSSNVTESIDSEGIDIVISLDVSGSMLAEDFKPNRIEAAKNVALNFIDQRPTDRIGLVIFAGESFTQCPITIDHNVLKEQVSQVKSGVLVDGTSIGMGLATAVDRLRNSKAKSRVVILLTDGVNNTGLIDPNTALEIAKAYKIRVYTIGIGTQGQAPYPVQTPFGTQTQMMPVQIDEPLLKQMATQTGGKYFRATGNRSLAAIYQEIDKMEKTRVEISSYKHYAELFFPFACIAIICLGAEVLLRYTLFRSIT
ncbi:MAG: aerotolerance regulator BatA [Bacteroidetes bacterium 46-16]|nr:MAG: aerotolerance regulator BatA [Bacteroidetes bacterium 46-16]